MQIQANFMVHFAKLVSTHIELQLLLETGPARVQAQTLEKGNLSMNLLVEQSIRTQGLWLHYGDIVCSVQSGQFANWPGQSANWQSGQSICKLRCTICQLSRNLSNLQIVPTNFI